eukprot:CAMPEP_0201490576 /NCGR_PEP_ID=MMETSP0151_2-20130828/26641_1 /ASSEMBLY_ACC=CAM_ASM_000257 /TAXON_ID=200890 /ORGANISM="Paramoeba atlantica, Strain 621/1 / CCAP 1560/9" /LENGTH=282 /DNA_ID=CAMNT_0047876577 /DNA_START=35 /DNA_END=883 /DNA_ORIENTATION=+
MQEIADLWVEDENDTYTSSSLDVPIHESNVGYQLLLKMGWDKSKSLGKKGNGIIDPIRVAFREQRDFVGVGKYEEYDHYCEVATEQRRLLETEKEETEQLIEKRRQKAEQKENKEQAVTKMVRPFYCELCDKQYKNVAEYDTHLNSYDHNHKARFLETKKRMRKTPSKSAIQKKEEKRELKRIEKLTALHGSNPSISEKTVVETPQQSPATKKTEPNYSFGGGSTSSWVTISQNPQPQKEEQPISSPAEPTPSPENTTPKVSFKTKSPMKFSFGNATKKLKK